MTKREKLEKVREKIRSACTRAGRKPEDVLLLAVGKTKPASDIAEFFSLGQKSFGENYVQEALDKIEALKDKAIDWHFIGTLQSNKAKFIPGNFSLFHGLDTLRLAQKVDAAAAAKSMKQATLIEVNLDGQLSKGGVAHMDIAFMLDAMKNLKSLQIKGLMCIPDPHAQARDPRRNFAKLRELMERLNASGAYREKLSILSMGMTLDFEAAIQEGSHIVRIGTALFGERPPK